VPLNLPGILGGLLADIVPGGSVVSEAAKSYIQRRVEAARDILVDELRRGAISADHVAVNDALIGVMFRYGRAAYEGSARVNLRLLAKAIRGQLLSGKLIADEFFRYADILASLSREEIVFLGALYRVGEGKVGAELHNVTTAEWASVVDTMSAAGLDKNAVYPTALRCLRTGFVIAMPAVGILNTAPSPLLMELGKIVDFDEALRSESA
jgi:hypothetical protein